MKKSLFITVALFFSIGAHAAPATFYEAKNDLRRHVYFDRESAGELYCGCKYKFKKTKGAGAWVDHASCGYKVRAQEHRAERTEVEHLVPAHSFGQARQCWQKGGRKHCNQTDPVFNRMESNLHGLVLVVGEVNGDRSNFRPASLPALAPQYGACQSKVDFKARKFEPRDEAKGMMARAYFYMHDRYDLKMSNSMQRLLMAWDRQFPVSNWERERDRRNAGVMGHHNPFVTGEKKWTLGHKNSASGVVGQFAPDAQVAQEQNSRPGRPIAIKGNTRSKVYHLSEGCPSYDRVSAHNSLMFRSEKEALAAGYRKAGNCR